MILNSMFLLSYDGISCRGTWMFHRKVSDGRLVTITSYGTIPLSGLISVYDIIEK